MRSALKYVAIGIDEVTHKLLAKPVLSHGGPELLDREHGCFYGRRGDGFEKSVGHGLLDYHSADIETVLPAPIYHIFAGAVITWSRVPAAIMDHQTAATMAASGQTLQECRSLSHCSSRLMGPRPRVGIEPRLVGFEGGPIDETRMMVPDENGPLIHGQMPRPLFDDTCVAFVPACDHNVLVIGPPSEPVNVY